MLLPTNLVGQAKNENMSQHRMDARDPIALSLLPVGETARLHATTLDEATLRLLSALGLTPSSEFRLCKAGEPCIIQVRTTRIGLSRGVADRIMVMPTVRKVA
jgi:Fe2+ transport system protein FeoA